jgi:hypothetical protein
MGFTCKWLNGEESRDKAGAFSSFHILDPPWREEVLCHVSKIVNGVGSDEGSGKCVGANTKLASQ